MQESTHSIKPIIKPNSLISILRLKIEAATTLGLGSEDPVQVHFTDVLFQFWTSCVTFLDLILSHPHYEDCHNPCLDMIHCSIGLLPSLPENHLLFQSSRTTAGNVPIHQFLSLEESESLSKTLFWYLCLSGTIIWIYYWKIILIKDERLDHSFIALEHRLFVRLDKTRFRSISE